MRVAVAQIALSTEIEANVEKITRFISRAAREQIQLLCFPECSVTGYVRDFTTVEHDAVLEALNHIHAHSMRESVSAIVGSPCLVQKARFNSALALLPTGERFSYYKINLTAPETAYFHPGQEPTTFTVDMLTCGLLICRDQNDAMLAHAYKALGVDVLFILAAHYYEPREAERKLDKNRALPIARAVENRLFVLKANAVGSVDGTVSLGGSLIADPFGYVVQEADRHSEALLSCEVEKERVT
ncbi:MAG: carbon-nitrogen hydrolase family protein [Candidatus Methanospirareceae archaeon]